jgi:hypothetical protein
MIVRSVNGLTTVAADLLKQVSCELVDADPSSLNTTMILVHSPKHSVQVLLLHFGLPLLFHTYPSLAVVHQLADSSERMFMRWSGDFKSQDSLPFNRSLLAKVPRESPLQRSPSWSHLPFLSPRVAD